MINGMEIGNLKDESGEDTTPQYVSSEVLQFNTDDENLFFNSACTYLEDYKDFNTDNAKIRETYLKEDSDPTQKLKIK